MVRAPFVCLVTGYSGSGKTTLVEKLIENLTSRGLRVASAKHHGHALEVDTEGKDSWRHKKAGAVAAFLVSKGETVAFFPTPEDTQTTPDDLLSLCPPGTDLLLVEGFKGLEGYPKVEVVDSNSPEGAPADLLCVAAARPADVNLTDTLVFDRDDHTAIASLIYNKIFGGL